MSKDRTLKDKTSNAETSKRTKCRKDKTLKAVIFQFRFEIVIHIFCSHCGLLKNVWHMCNYLFFRKRISSNSRFPSNLFYVLSLRRFGFRRFVTWPIPQYNPGSSIFKEFHDNFVVDLDKRIRPTQIWTSYSECKFCTLPRYQLASISTG